MLPPDCSNKVPVTMVCSFRTALAESELEYNTEHVSTAIYVRLPVTKRPESLREVIGG